MTHAPYDAYNQSNNTLSLSVPLVDGTSFLVIGAYTDSQSKAVIALVLASCLSLVATVGLLAAIAMSAFNTRGSKNPNLFVRNHVVFYFVSLLLSDVLQAIGSIMNSTWVREEAVVYGSFCSAQGVIKHIADVAIALWSLVIASRTFLVLFLRIETRRYTMWIVLIGVWSFVGVIVTGGPATARTDIHGPYYGIAGAWCWISANYTFQRIALDYMIMFISAGLAFILYSLVFLKSRGIVRARSSLTSVASANEESTKKYEHRLARQMLLYPIAYTIMILPIAFCRFLSWTGHHVPFAMTIVSGFIYLLSGVVHVILFSCTRRILPPRSMLPKFLISYPSVVHASTEVAENDFDDYYSESVTEHSKYATAEKGGGHPNGRGAADPSGIMEGADPRDPFEDPVLPHYIDEAIIKRVHSPDSDAYDSASSSPNHTPGTLSPVTADYVDRSVLPEQPSPQDRAPAQGETRAERSLKMPIPLKHREGEAVEVPMSPDSVLMYYDGT